MRKISVPYYKNIRSIHKGMKRRCYDPKEPAYKNYGQRGISICDEWLDVMAFVLWGNANGYAPGLSIERIDNNGNYEPINCKWIPKGEQARNTRLSVKVTAFGETKTITEWGEDPRCVVSRKGLDKRLRKGLDPEIAMTIKQCGKFGGGSILDAEGAREAYRLVVIEGKTRTEAGRLIGVDARTISEIVLGHSWKELGLPPLSSDRGGNRRRAILARQQADGGREPGQ